jgi:hypothetical protein
MQIKSRWACNDCGDEPGPPGARTEGPNTFIGTSDLQPDRVDVQPAMVRRGTTLTYRNRGP